MPVDLSEAALELVRKHLDTLPGRRGRPASPASLIFMEAARLGAEGLTWRSLDPSIKNRTGFNVRVLKWIDGGFLDALDADLRASADLTHEERDHLLAMTAAIRTLKGRPRSKPGKPWTSKNPRKPYPKYRKRPEKKASAAGSD